MAHSTPDSFGGSLARFWPLGLALAFVVVAPPLWAHSPAWAAEASDDAPLNNRADLAALAAQAPRISPAEVEARRAQGTEVVVLDVRSAQAYERGHILGARSTPRSQLAQHLASLPKDRLLVTYCTCADDFNAALAVMSLKAAGFTQVAALRGGMYAWQDAQLPVTLPASPTTSGSELYLAHCATCHQVDGSGLAGVVPALKGSPWLSLDSAKPLLVLVGGGVRTGRYPTGMPAFARLSDAELAALATHMRQSFAQKPGRVAPAAAAAARAEWSATRPSSTQLP